MKLFLIIFFTAFLFGEANSQCKSFTKYEYDPSGKISRILVSSGAGDTVEKRYSYTNDSLISRIELYTAGNNSGKSEFEYQYGRLARRTEYDSQGKKTQETIYTLDNEGHIVKENTVQDSGSKPEVTEYIYDDGLLEEAFRGDDRWIYEYNNSDRLTEIHEYSKGRLINYRKYSYNSAGKVIKNSLYKEKGGEHVVFSYTAYTYDSSGRLESECFTELIK